MGRFLPPKGSHTNFLFSSALHYHISSHNYARRRVTYTRRRSYLRGGTVKMRGSVALSVIFQIKFVRSYVGIPLWVNGSPRNETQLVQRDQLPPLTTCGYLSGDPKQIRTANNGYNCRFDKNNQLWGFCPTTVINPIDCGLAGACIDEEGCSDGCGQTGNTALTTFTW